MPRALKTCSQPGCPELVQFGRCPDHQRQAEQRRGSARDRGYGRQHERRFRRAVLLKDPLCVCTGGCCPAHTHGPPSCLAPSRHADHWPRDTHELRRLGLDEHNPQYGRGLCAACHSHHTTHAQPGGWHGR